MLRARLKKGKNVQNGTTEVSTIVNLTQVFPCGIYKKWQVATKNLKEANLRVLVERFMEYLIKNIWKRRQIQLNFDSEWGKSLLTKKVSTVLFQTFPSRFLS